MQPGSQDKNLWSSNPTTWEPISSNADHSRWEMPDPTSQGMSQSYQQPHYSRWDAAPGGSGGGGYSMGRQTQQPPQGGFGREAWYGESAPAPQRQYPPSSGGQGAGSPWGYYQSQPQNPGYGYSGQGGFDGPGAYGQPSQQQRWPDPGMGPGLKDGDYPRGPAYMQRSMPPIGSGSGSAAIIPAGHQGPGYPSRSYGSGSMPGQSTGLGMKSHDDGSRFGGGLGKGPSPQYSPAAYQQPPLRPGMGPSPYSTQQAPAGLGAPFPRGGAASKFPGGPPSSIPPSAVPDRWAGLAPENQSAQNPAGKDRWLSLGGSNAPSSSGPPGGASGPSIIPAAGASGLPDKRSPPPGGDDAKKSQAPANRWGGGGADEKRNVTTMGILQNPNKAAPGPAAQQSAAGAEGPPPFAHQKFDTGRQLPDFGIKGGKGKKGAPPVPAAFGGGGWGGKPSEKSGGKGGWDIASGGPSMMGKGGKGDGKGMGMDMGAAHHGQDVGKGGKGFFDRFDNGKGMDSMKGKKGGDAQMFAGGRGGGDKGGKSRYSAGKGDKYDRDYDRANYPFVGGSGRGNDKPGKLWGFDNQPAHKEIRAKSEMKRAGGRGSASSMEFGGRKGGRGGSRRDDDGKGGRSGKKGVIEGRGGGWVAVGREGGRGASLETRLAQKVAAKKVEVKRNAKIEEKRSGKSDEELVRVRVSAPTEWSWKDVKKLLGSYGDATEVHINTEDGGRFGYATMKAEHAKAALKALTNTKPDDYDEPIQVVIDANKRQPKKEKREKGKSNKARKEKKMERVENRKSLLTGLNMDALKQVLSSKEAQKGLSPDQLDRLYSKVTRSRHFDPRTAGGIQAVRSLLNSIDIITVWERPTGQILVTLKGESLPYPNSLYFTAQETPNAEIAVAVKDTYIKAIGVQEVQEEPEATAEIAAGDSVHKYPKSLYA
ncbi:hypothetical protein DIPPA_19936 [Diplonema papillatum]|nr:hypothetical protein DIPPA_19936 [Diplonema papillatum]